MSEVIKTKFEKNIDMAAKICTIFIPIVLTIFGYWFQQTQATASKAERDTQTIASKVERDAITAEAKKQRNFDRVADLLKSLSSKEVMERKLAVKFLEGLKSVNEFPPELIDVLAEVSSADQDLATANDANKVLKSVAQTASKNNNKVVQKKVDDAIKSSARVYFQVPKYYNKTITNNLLMLLSTKGYSLPKIETVSNSPNSNEIRYFNEKDKPVADSIFKIFKDEGVQANLKKIDGFENKVSRSQVEVWLQ